MTPERYARLVTVLERRQLDLTVLLDNVHKPHNFSAILRTCDAVGIHQAHAVWPQARLRPSAGHSAGSAKWVRVRTHASIDQAADYLKASGHQLVAADPALNSLDFRELDYTQPTALVLGAELEGMSTQALARADHRVGIPMLGMVHSLNVSVAAAVLLFEVQRQRRQAGLYQRCALDGQSYRDTLFEWAHPQVADFCRRHTLPYPPLDERGEIVGPLSRHTHGPEG